MQRFFCWGYLVAGPNWKASIGTAMLISAPAGIFLAFVAPYMGLHVHIIILVIRCASLQQLARVTRLRDKLLSAGCERDMPRQRRAAQRGVVEPLGVPPGTFRHLSLLPPSLSRLHRSCILPVLAVLFLMLTACRDPGIIPRQDPDPEYLNGQKPRYARTSQRAGRATM